MGIVGKMGSDTEFEKRHAARVAESLKRIGIVIGIATGLVALFGVYLTVPSRVEATEKAIEKLRADRERDRELLIEIKTSIDYLRQKSP